LADCVAASTTAGGQNGAAGHPYRKASALAKETSPFGKLLSALLQQVQSHRNSKHLLLLSGAHFASDAVTAIYVDHRGA
jgi:hypothetical protein